VVIRKKCSNTRTFTWRVKLIALAFGLTIASQLELQLEAQEKSITRKEKQVEKWLKRLTRADELDQNEVLLDYPTFEMPDLQIYITKRLIREIKEKKENVAPIIIEALGMIHYDCNACEECDEPKCDSSEVEPDLLHILQHSSKEVQLLTLETLRDIVPTSNSSSLLYSTINGEDAELSCIALQTLSKIPNANYQPALAGINKLLRNPNKCAVGDALVATIIMKEAAEPTIDSLIALFINSTNQRERVRYAIAEIGSKGVQNFAKLLHSDEPMALIAVDNLAWMHHPEATTQLIAAYPTVTESVRIKIRRVLIRDKPADERIGTLFRELLLLPDFDSKKEAIGGLLQHSLASEKFSDEIIRLLEEGSENVKLCAFEILEGFIQAQLTIIDEPEHPFWRGTRARARSKVSFVMRSLYDLLSKISAQDTSVHVREKARMLLSLGDCVGATSGFSGLKYRITTVVKWLFGLSPLQRVQH
jgi:hypothetical protein